MKRNRDKQITLLLLVLLLVTVGAAMFVLENAMDDNDMFQAKNSNAGALSTESQYANLTPNELMNRITVGFNIGNFLDGSQENTIITEEFLNAVKRSGFNAIRLPVSWSFNTYRKDGKLTINEEWLDQVTEIVDSALSYNFYVILDSHHDETILWADMEDIDTVSDNLQDLWSQIAEHFMTYDERLIFESFDEISVRDTSLHFDESTLQAVNILNQLFVDTVRASGGRNTSRILICDTYLSESSDAALDSFVLPHDEAMNRLAVSIHNYSLSYNQDIKKFFEKIADHSLRIGAPVIITEFGTADSFVPAEYRPNHAGNYIACANESGIKCFWWDDGDSYGLFDRQSSELLYMDIVESLMNPAEFRTTKISTTVFDSIGDYSYAAISPDSGLLEDFPDGALTLNPGKQGVPVTYGSEYHISLIISGSGDGLRLAGLCFYDAQQDFVAYHAIDRELSYTITPPENAVFMRVCFYHPWEQRNLEDYISYFEKSELNLEIAEYAIK